MCKEKGLDRKTLESYYASQDADDDDKESKKEEFDKPMSDLFEDDFFIKSNPKYKNNKK